MFETGGQKKTWDRVPSGTLYKDPVIRVSCEFCIVQSSVPFFDTFRSDPASADMIDKQVTPKQKTSKSPENNC